MKSIKLLVLSLCGLFSMSSCVNDFLDRDPMDIISEDLVWSNENAVNAYMECTKICSSNLMHG